MMTPGSTGETFSRAGTATYVDKNGILQTAAQDAERAAHYEQGVRTILLEGAGANGFTFPQDLGNAVWTKDNTTVVANATAAPDGTLTADKLVEDATAPTTHQIARSLGALADNTPQAFQFFAKAAERSWLVVVITDKTSTITYNAFVNLATGAVGTIFGGTMRAVPMANGWYRIACTWNSGAGASAPVIRVRLATANNLDNYSGDGASGVYLWGLDPENDKSFASSYTATTRSPDLIGWTIPDAPHAMEWVVEFFERGAAAASFAGVAYLGNDARTGATLVINANGNGYTVNHSNGTSSVFSAITPAPPVNNRVKLRARLYDDGSVQLWQSLNGAAETTGGRSAALEFAAAWGGQTFRLNSRGTSSQGNAAYISATLTDLS